MDTDWLRSLGNGKNNIVFCTPRLRPQSSNNLHLAHQVSWFYRRVIRTEVEFKAVCLHDLLVWIWLHIPQAGGLKRSSLSVALQQRDLYTWVLRTCDMLTQLWFWQSFRWQAHHSELAPVWLWVDVQSSSEPLTAGPFSTIFDSWLQCQKLLLSNTRVCTHIALLTNDYTKTNLCAR